MSDPTVYEMPQDTVENTIDIYVYTGISHPSPLLKEPLERMGYKVTLFSDSPQLYESLKSGKPNLLVCDITAAGDEAYEVCRAIKVDAENWIIPVLVITRAVSLGDLLKVLDCNADNFIAYSPDPAYLVSLVDGMMVTPVERPTPDQIKTQFKIQHDNRIFVVMASRRKLLEVLLSAYEIAVKRSADLDVAKDRIDKLQRTIQKLDDSVNEHTKVIDIMNATLKQKEVKERSLGGELAEKIRVIDEKNVEINWLNTQLSEQRQLAAQGEERLRSLIAERDRVAAAHCTEIDDFKQQVFEQADQIDVLKEQAASTQRLADEEKALRSTAEEKICELMAAQEQSARQLKELLTGELDKIRTALESETARAQAAEDATEAVRLVKAQVEQDAVRTISELRALQDRQSEWIGRLDRDLEAALIRVGETEDRLAAHKAECEHAEQALLATADAKDAELARVRAQFDAVAASLHEKEHAVKNLEAVLAAAVSDKEKLEAALAEMNQALAQAKTSLEAQEAAIAAAEQDFARSRAEMGAVRGDLAASAESLGRAQEQIDVLVKERDEARNRIRKIKEVASENLLANQDTIARLKEELEAEVWKRTAQQEQFDGAVRKAYELEQGLGAAAKDRAQAVQQTRSLSEELEQVKADLAAERCMHRTAQESLHGSLQERTRVLSDLEKFSDELEKAKSLTEAERRGREDAEERVKAAEQEKVQVLETLAAVRQEGEKTSGDQTAEMHNIRGELSAARDLQQSLEEQVRGLLAQQAQAEEKIEEVAGRLQKTLSALEEEHEARRFADEQLQHVRSEKERLEEELAVARAWSSILEPANDPAAPVPAAAAVVRVEESQAPVIVARYAPANIAPNVPYSITTAPSSSPITRVEDLFEPERGAPVPAAAKPMDDDADADIAGDDEDEGSDDDDDAPQAVFPSTGVAPYNGGLTFSRQQWLDLLKWAHHSGALSQDQRMQIVRMGRLIQKGRRLTNRQESQVRDLIGLVLSLGYRFL